MACCHTQEDQPHIWKRSASLPAHEPLRRLCTPARRALSVTDLAAQKEEHSVNDVDEDIMPTVSELFSLKEAMLPPTPPPFPSELLHLGMKLPELSTTLTPSAIDTNWDMNSYGSDMYDQYESCGICYEDKPPTEFAEPCHPDCAIAKRGGPYSRHCKDCITQYIRTELSEGNVRMRCPHSDCSAVLTTDQVRPYVAESQLEFFNRLVIIKSDNPNVRLCPRCSKVTDVPARIKRNKRKGTKIICTDCQFVWCFECESPWHDDVSCRSARKGNKQFRRWIKGRTTQNIPNGQRCPKCRIPIQRTTGCNQMTCSRCHTRFCYRCGQRMISLGILGDHYDRYSVAGCPYILLSEHGVRRRAVRGAALTAGITVGVPLAVGAGAVVVAAVVAASPFYGTYKLGKKIVREL